MIVSDVMSTNVITVPSKMPVAEARRIMDIHNFRRLPVVDWNKPVGVVSKDALDRTGPSQLVNVNIHEMSELLRKITVKQVMHKNVVTVTPSTTVEDAVALAQREKVGSLLVVKGEFIVGIVTTNDFFYKVLNPILGIGMTGSRIAVHNCYKGEDVKKVLSALIEANIEIITLFTIDFPETGKHQLIVHIEPDNSGPAVYAIQKIGFEAAGRSR